MRSKTAPAPWFFQFVKAVFRIRTVAVALGGGRFRSRTMVGLLRERGFVAWSSWLWQKFGSMKFTRYFFRSLLAIFGLLGFAWAVGALYFDGPSPWLAGTLALAVGLGVVFMGSWVRKLGVVGLFWGTVLAWWVTIQPSNVGNWQAEVAQTSWAEIEGDEVTIHNLRNFKYRTAADYTPIWETRKVRLSEVTGVDLFINYWGSPWMAHPIASFQFVEGPPVAFSIETRKKVGQSYSAIGGIYRQYELIYIVADERDVVQVRTRYRKGEEAYLYRIAMSPAEARGRFLEYLASINRLHEVPRWYNAITTNCTTGIRDQHPKAKRQAWDWRMLVNGKGDELTYELGGFRTDGLPFTELKRRALIQSVTEEVNDSGDFSQLIRAGRPGFGSVQGSAGDAVN